MTLCKKGSEIKTCEKVSNSKVSMTLFKKGSDVENLENFPLLNPRKVGGL